MQVLSGMVNAKYGCSRGMSVESELGDRDNLILG